MTRGKSRSGFWKKKVGRSKTKKGRIFLDARTHDKLIYKVGFYDEQAKILLCSTLIEALIRVGAVQAVKCSAVQCSTIDRAQLAF
jgi:hypothetical protein